MITKVLENIPSKVLEILHFENGVQDLDFVFYLCDDNDNIISKVEVLDNFSITHNMNASIKRVLEVEMLDINDDDVDLVNKRIKPVVIIGGFEYSLGIFCIESPTKNLNGDFKTRKIKCYDKTVILQQDCLVENLFLKEGTLVTNAIEEVIYASGIKKVDIQKSNKVLNRDYEFLVGVSRLEIINTLLSYINFTSINFSSQGYSVAEPYTLPTEREIEFNYSTNSLSIIKPERSLELDLFNVPNVFIATSTNAETESLTSVYINDNPNSKVSTVNRGRNITKKYEVSDIADQATLDAYVRRLAYDYTTIYEKISFTTGVVPFHSNSNCLYINDFEAKVCDKFIETSWRIKKNEMEHNARKVVYI